MVSSLVIVKGTDVLLPCAEPVPANSAFSVVEPAASSGVRAQAAAPEPLVTPSQVSPSAPFPRVKETVAPLIGLPAVVVSVADAVKAS